MLNKTPFKNRTIGFWLGLGAAALAIVSAIFLIILDYGDKSFSMEAFILMLVGGISFVGVVFLNLQTVVAIPAVLYVMGFSYELGATLPPLSDVWNGVNFIGGNAFMGVTFTVLFFISAVVAIVSNFMEQSK